MAVKAILQTGSADSLGIRCSVSRVESSRVESSRVEPQDSLLGEAIVDDRTAVGPSEGS